MAVHLRTVLFGQLDELRVEPTDKHVRAVLGGREVAGTHGACSSGSRGA